jgi:hypothetical protein
LLHWRIGQSGGAPDSPVNYSGAAPRIPEGEQFGVGFPGAPDTVGGAPDTVGGTPDTVGGTPDSPVRQTRAHFGCLLLSLFEPFLGLFIGLL